MNECYGCKRRSIEPNCHDPQRCEFWAKKTQENQRKYEQRREDVILARPLTKYKKNSNGRPGEYYPQGGKSRPKSGVTKVKGGL